MKKILLLITICILSLTGCTTYTDVGYVDAIPNCNIYYTPYKPYKSYYLGNLYYHRPYHKHYYTPRKKYNHPPRHPNRNHKSGKNRRKR